MRVFTAFSLLLTAIAGCIGFQASGETAELMKLIYAYFALTTVVCALIVAAAHRPGERSRQVPVSAMGDPTLKSAP